MSDQVLPPDAKRAQQYDTANWVAQKILLPDGSVVWTVPVKSINSLITEKFDQIDLSYTDGKVTKVTYSLGGEVVNYVELSYDIEGNLTKVQKV